MGQLMACQFLLLAFITVVMATSVLTIIIVQCLVLKLSFIAASSANFSTVLTSSRIVLLLFLLITRRAFIGLKAPLSDRAKHIDLRKHFLHDACQQGILQLRKIDSKFDGAVLLTKPFKDTMLLNATANISWAVDSIVTVCLRRRACLDGLWQARVFQYAGETVTCVSTPYSRESHFQLRCTRY